MGNNLNKDLSLALQNRRRGNTEYALKILLSAFEKDPADVYVKYNLAATFGDLGYFQRALELCEELVSVKFHNFHVFLVLGRARLGLGQTEGAMKAYQRAKKYNNSEPILCREIAQLTWMMTGDKKETLKVISEFELSNFKGPSLKVLEAEILGHIQEFRKQYDLLASLMLSFPDDRQLQYLYSRSALKNREFEEALSYSSLIYENNKSNSDVTIHHLNCLMACGGEKRAKNVVESALRLHPRNQHLIAIQAIIWRILDDSRYRQLYNYDLFVHQQPLTTPSGWTNLESYLTDLEDSLNDLHRFQSHPFSQSVRQGSQVSHINKFADKALRAYEQALKKNIIEYLNRAVGKDKASSLSPSVSSAWSVKLFENGHHTNHVHQEGWLSSVCHLTPTNSQGHNNQGCLKLGEPGFWTPRNVPAEKIIKPLRGHVVIFPSYMWHGTIPLIAPAERLTIAADIILKDDI